MDNTEDFDEAEVLNCLIGLRKKAGMTQKKVEDRLQWRRGTLYDYEKGRLKISLEATWQLLKVYGGTWQALFETPAQPGEKARSRLFRPLLQLGLISQPISDPVQQMRSDPIILAAIGLDQQHAARPVLHLLMELLTEAQRRDFFVELCRYVNSLITADEQIRPEEKKVRDLLLEYSPLALDESEKASILRAYDGRYQGAGLQKKFPKESLKHLLIWILFIIALSDGEVNHHEMVYIEAVAENIDMAKVSFDYIKKHFVGSLT